MTATTARNDAFSRGWGKFVSPWPQSESVTTEAEVRIAQRGGTQSLEPRQKNLRQTSPRLPTVKIHFERVRVSERARERESEYER